MDTGIQTRRYRSLLIKNGTHAVIRSRNDKDLTRMYPGVTSAALRLRAHQAIVDGEIFAVDDYATRMVARRGAFPAWIFEKSRN